MVTLKIDKDKCIGCGLCASFCPDVFEMDDKGKAGVKSVAGCKKCDCQEAAKACPVQAIIIKG